MAHVSAVLVLAVVIVGVSVVTERTDATDISSYQAAVDTQTTVNVVETGLTCNTALEFSSTGSDLTINGLNFACGLSSVVPIVISATGRSITFNDAVFAPGNVVAISNTASSNTITFTGSSSISGSGGTSGAVYRDTASVSGTTLVLSGLTITNFATSANLFDIASSTMAISATGLSLNANVVASVFALASSSTTTLTAASITTLTGSLNAGALVHATSAATGTFTIDGGSVVSGIRGRTLFESTASGSFVFALAGTTAVSDTIMCAGSIARLSPAAIAGAVTVAGTVSLTSTTSLTADHADGSLPLGAVFLNGAASTAAAFASPSTTNVGIFPLACAVYASLPAVASVAGLQVLVDDSAAISPLTIPPLTYTGCGSDGVVVSGSTARSWTMTGATIDCAGAGRAITVSGLSAPLAITDGTLTNGLQTSSPGGLFQALNAAAPISLTGTAFATATSTSGGCLAFSGGGAAMNLTSVSFTACTASANGGAVDYAVSAGSSASVWTGVTITTSTATSGNGGGLAIALTPAHTLTLDTTSITFCDAGSNGGGLHVAGGGLALNTATINNNVAGGDGGCVSLDDAPLTFSAVNIDDCLGNRGGAFAVAGASSVVQTPGFSRFQNNIGCEASFMLIAGPSVFVNIFHSFESNLISFGSSDTARWIFGELSFTPGASLSASSSVPSIDMSSMLIDDGSPCNAVRGFAIPTAATLAAAITGGTVTSLTPGTYLGTLSISASHTVDLTGFTVNRLSLSTSGTVDITGLRVRFGAASSGGCVSISSVGVTASFHNVHIAHCSSSAFGGGVLVRSTGQSPMVTFDADCTISDAFADDGGGAIYLRHSGGGTPIVTFLGTITRCSSTSSAVVGMDTSTGTLTLGPGAVIQDSTSIGGAIESFGGGSLVVNSVTIRRHSGYGTGDGSLISLSSTGTAVVTGSTFVDSVTGRAALYIASGTPGLTVTGTSFTRIRGCLASVLYINPAASPAPPVTFDAGCAFTDNVAHVADPSSAFPLGEISDPSGIRTVTSGASSSGSRVVHAPCTNMAVTSAVPDSSIPLLQTYLDSLPPSPPGPITFAPTVFSDCSVPLRLSSSLPPGMVIDFTSVTFNCATAQTQVMTIIDSPGITVSNLAVDGSLSAGSALATSGGCVVVNGTLSGPVVFNGLSLSNCNVSAGAASSGQALTLAAVGARISINNGVLTARPDRESVAAGGGVYIGAPPGVGRVDVVWSGGSVSGFAAELGGGIFATNADVSLADLTVTDNVASLGSAVAVGLGATVNVASSALTSNSARNGTIYIAELTTAELAMGWTAPGALVMTNTTVRQNRACYGCLLASGRAASATPGSATVTHGIIVHNLATSAVANLSSPLNALLDADRGAANPTIDAGAFGIGNRVEPAPCSLARGGAPTERAFVRVRIDGCVSGCILGPQGGTVVVGGEGFRDGDVSVSINGNVTKVEMSSARALVVTDTSVQFDVPGGLGDGYPSITLNVSATSISLTGLVYVDLSGAVAADCVRIGQYYADGQCKSCPEGGYCPGGVRIWPLRGYWSPSERNAPGRCTLEEACCGAMGAVAACPVVLHDSGARVTARCDEDLGYTGRYCAECREPDFYSDAGVCRACERGDTAELAVLVLAALILIGLVTLAVALLSVVRMSSFVSIVLSLQQFVFVGRTTSARISGDAGKTLSDIFRALSFILFDVEFVKPNCYFASAGSSNFARLFWGTLVLVALAAVLFVAAAWVYAVIGHRLVLRRNKSKTPEAGDGSGNDDAMTGVVMESMASTESGEKDEDEDKDEEEEEETGSASTATSSSTASMPSKSMSSSSSSSSGSSGGSSSGSSSRASSIVPAKTVDDIESLTSGEDETEPRTRGERWARRARVSIVMLLAAVYLQITLRVINAFHCTTVNGSARLAVELSTECFQGAHTATLAVAILLAAMYLVAFPVVVLWLMYRAYGANAEAMAELKGGAFAFLVRGLQPGVFWFRVATLVTSVVLVLETVLIAGTSVRIMVVGLSLLVNVVLISLFWPFKSTHNNLFQLTIGIGSSVQLVIFADSDGLDGGKSTIQRNVLLSFVIIVSVGVVAWRSALYLRRRAEGRVDKSEVSDIDHLSARHATITALTADLSARDATITALRTRLRSASSRSASSRSASSRSASSRSASSRSASSRSASASAATPNPVPAAVAAVLAGAPLALRALPSPAAKAALLTALADRCAGHAVIDVLAGERASLTAAAFYDMLAAAPAAVPYYLAHLRAVGAYPELIAATRALLPPPASAWALLRAALAAPPDRRLPALEAAAKAAADPAARESPRGFLRSSIAAQIALLRIQAKVQKMDAAAAAGSNPPPILLRFPPRPLLGRSVYATAHYLLFYHRAAPDDSVASPRALAAALALSPAAYMRKSALAAAQIGDWELLRSLAWAGADYHAARKALAKNPAKARRRKPKSVIGWEPFVAAAVAHDAPPDLVDYFLGLIADPEARIKLATRCKHWAVVARTLESLADLHRLRQLRAFIIRKHGRFGDVRLLDLVDGALARLGT
ncbi:uncharacterized protein AMSG_11170 [Thecamonas trahens ATCC 50062]|uniref:Uncharacterized protein n=1 Tax=Thecamonas trahens ATCC 50062 TaxID=461836 RepID=A0A0L0DU39_THETB|nr:hypothetical protein AMSG_11170 [Thecamonas trahens ATCC 50062]KNC55712.1 hypothetical protein AMSG_11170 [Thecamonas trahens ATCC 50062]|eukprot:XP_013752923.1 hypothetical protein AMSG_11170 [Thecamonas trahens ATCC 50062]